MALTFERVAIVGATGPTGRALASELVGRKCAVRVVSRRADVLNARFPGSQFEKKSGDAMEFASLAAALQGCDLVIDCIGLPAERMADHPATARNIARLVRESGARCVQVSSYWSFMPIKELPVSERHPRQGGPPWARFRRETEDILRNAGAAIVHLPDFFGPHVHTSTLQLGLVDAVHGKPMSWIGPADVKRDYIYIPDAMKIVAELLTRKEGYGEEWVVRGSGPVSASQLAGILTRLLNHEVRVRAAPPWLLRILGFFNKDLRGFMQVVPDYVKPISFDDANLDRLLGRMARTPYEIALRATIASMQPASA
ncbi:MAG TPA: NAD-dependent epimerase/dehydratase family protein [Burkholderiales bacterium]